MSAKVTEEKPSQSTAVEPPALCLEALLLLEEKTEDLTETLYFLRKNPNLGFQRAVALTWL